MERLRYEANEFKFNNGYSMPVHVLAKRIADICQVYTQEASNRAMAAIMLLVGADDEKGAQCFKVDPAGHYLPYKAVATGKSEAEAMNYLEKKVGEFGGLDEKGTIEMVLIMIINPFYYFPLSYPHTIRLLISSLFSVRFSSS